MKTDDHQHMVDRKESGIGFSVIPAKAGMQLNESRFERDWTPVFTGVTTKRTSYELITHGEPQDKAVMTNDPASRSTPRPPLVKG